MENEYYGVASTPTEDYLAHYGIKGMKWGVRRARQSGNDRALARQYRKAEKKLAKLEKRAASGKKYAKRAAALGAGAAAAGGLAIAGTEGVSRGIAKVGGAGMKVSKSIGRGLTLVPGRNKVSQALHNTGVAMYRAGERGSEMHKGIANVSGAVSKWGKGNSVGKALNQGANSVIQAAPNNITRAANKALKNSGHAGLGVQANKLSGVSNNTIARIGAGAIGAGLAGAAGYNAYRAATTKRAAAKAAAFRKEMNKQFAGTKYANSGGQSKKRRRK